MITAISYNMANINFKSQKKMSQTSERLGKYLAEKNIDTGKVLLASGVSASAAAGVSMSKPDFVSSPEAAQYGLMGGMASTMGVMASSYVKNKQAKAEPAEDDVKPLVKEVSSQKPSSKKESNAMQKIADALNCSKTIRKHTWGCAPGETKKIQESYIDWDKIKNVLTENPNVDINKIEKYGRGLLGLAQNENQQDVVDLISKNKNLDVNRADQYGWTPIHYLCNHGDTDALKNVLELHKDADINKLTKNNDSCMSLAVNHNYSEIVDLLSKNKNLDVNKAGKEGWTAIHYLCRNGYIDALKNVLELHKDADINKLTKNNDSCMMLAINSGYSEIVDLLSQNENLDVNKAGKEGWTAIHYLCRNGYTDALKNVLELHKDADINKCTRDGNSPMVLAIQNNRSEIIDLLSKSENFDVNRVNKNGDTDLHILGRNGYTDVINNILERHDINDELIQSCIDDAKRAFYPRKDVVALLSDYQAKKTVA